MSDTVRLARHGGFAHVTLARPDVRNAFNGELIEALRKAFAALATEPPDRLRGVVLAGEGRTFSAGADVTWMRDAAEMSIEDNERDAARMQAMFDAIDVCPVPVVARVHGAALGGGMGLCAVSDIVVATRDATFGFTETKLGIVPAVISTYVVPKIGISHARALFPTGQRFSAERAREIGLVHEVVGDEAALDERVKAILAELAGAGPHALRAAKEIAVAASAGRAARDEMPRRIARQRVSEEGQEGLRAFLDGRDPAWRDA